MDGEWSLGIGSRKMDLLIIGLLNGRVFLFHLAQMCRNGAQFLLALKSLLEDPGIIKTGNQICYDVNKLTGWGVTLGPVEDLGLWSSCV